LNPYPVEFIRETKMSFARFVTAAMGSAIIFIAAPSHAQQNQTKQIQLQKTMAKPAAANPTGPAPVRRDHRTNTRDHRAGSSASAPGGVKVTDSGRKRGGSSPCIRSILGGPCIGGTPAKVAKAVAKIEPVSVGATGVYHAGKQTFGSKKSASRDHRKKN
jgi:hypothetical protein